MTKHACSHAARRGRARAGWAAPGQRRLGRVAAGARRGGRAGARRRPQRGPEKMDAAKCLAARRQREHSSAALDPNHSIWSKNVTWLINMSGKRPRRNEGLLCIIIEHMRWIRAEQNRVRASAACGLHCSFFGRSTCITG